MPALAYSDFDSLPDVLAMDRFEILLQPAGGGATNQILALRCQQISIPEEQVEPMVVAIQGMEFSYRGRRVYDKALSASFVETADGATTAALRTWMQSVVGSESHNGLSKDMYSTIGTLTVFDQSGNPALVYELDNVWPSQIPQIQLEGATASPFVVQVTFTFDRMLLNGVTIM